MTPKLTAKRYVFPVYGPVSYIDTFGAGRADVSYHHGDDIFGQLGQPLLAVADGTIFSVGWNKIGGNRLWLLDEKGNQFYYAHLSAFATTNGAHVRAGQVVGFMGRTGDAEGTPYHLHFEVHPVSLLYLGYDGAVDPTPYLEAWSHQQDLPFPIAAGWAPLVPGRAVGAGAGCHPARHDRHLDCRRPRSGVARACADTAQGVSADADAGADGRSLPRPTSAAASWSCRRSCSTTDSRRRNRRPRRRSCP